CAPGKNAASRTGDELARKSSRVPAAYSADVAHPSRLLFIDARVGDCDRMRGMGCDGIAGHRVVAQSTHLGIVLGERHGNSSRQLHDHADSGGCLVYVDIDGVYGYSRDAGELG